MGVNTIWPAPTTPSFFTSKAMDGEVEKCRLRDANRCDAEETAGFGEDMRRLDSRVMEAMGGGEASETVTLDNDLQFCLL